MNGIVDGGGGGGGDCGWVVGRPLFVVANVMCGGWLWLSDGVPDSHCFAAVLRYFAGCFALFREFRGWGFTIFAAVSHVFRVYFALIHSVNM
jgi:hypothetical protein